MQLWNAKRTSLEIRESELFIKAIDTHLEEELTYLFEDCNEDGRFKSDWREVEGRSPIKNMRIEDNRRTFNIMKLDLKNKYSKFTR